MQDDISIRYISTESGTEGRRVADLERRKRSLVAQYARSVPDSARRGGRSVVLVPSYARSVPDIG
eukprot:2448329-Rhodomonas_salina.1